MPRKPGQPWPEIRKEHAATFITDDNGYMLISGGCSSTNGHYDDMWLLEIISMTWKKVKIIVILYLVDCCCFLIYRFHCHLEALNFSVTLLLESTLQKISLKLFYMEVKIPMWKIRLAQQYTHLVNNFYFVASPYVSH